MSTRIREARICFLWFERWSDIWSNPNPIAMEFLRSADGYATEFDKAVADTVTGPRQGQEIPASRLEPNALTPPWPVKQAKYPHWFWVFYLGKSLENIDGQLALSKLAPFHVGFKATIKPRQKWIRVISDGFVYPHGIGLVLTIVLSLDSQPLPSGGVQTGVAVSNALQAYNDELYDVTWNGGQPVEQRMPDLANALLDSLRGQVLGPGAKAGDRSKLPLIVSVVARGDTDSVSTAPAQDGDVHHALQALSNFSKTWKADTLTPLKEASLRVRRSAPQGDILYHTGRGRTVWFSSSFTDKKPFIRSSGCYHRNLTLLHMQAEALIQSLAVRRDLLNKKAKVPDLLEQMAKDAAQQLSQLYSSEDGTYQSSSVRAYLDETPSSKKLVDDALASFGMDKLLYQAH